MAQTLPGTNRRGVSRGFFNRRWDLVQVFMTAHERNRNLEGRSIADIAKSQIGFALSQSVLPRTVKIIVGDALARTMA